MPKSVNQYIEYQDPVNGREANFASLVDENRLLRALIAEISQQCSALREQHDPVQIGAVSDKPSYH